LHDDARKELLTRVHARLDALGWPDLIASFVGLLTVARLASDAGHDPSVIA
jgi:hypothetical protein